MRAQAVAGSEVPTGNAAFFELIQRTASQLQVLFPGETNAPNTTTGKGGTPTPVNNGDAVNVTVNSVDATYHIVSNADKITLTSSDGSALLPNDFNLVGGTATASVYFLTSGSQTVTATDVSSTNLTTGVSSPITVQ